MFPSTVRPGENNTPPYNDTDQTTALATAGPVGGGFTNGHCTSGDYEAYTHDPNGNRTNLRKRDWRNIVYAYDALNRVTAKTYPQGGATQVHYGYDLRNLQLFARYTSTSGQGVTNSWDGFGRLSSSSSNMGGTARTVGSLYDRNSNRIRVTHPDGLAFTYTYDGLNRPAGLYQGTDLSVMLVLFGYNAQGQPASRSERHGSSVAYGFDPLGRLTSQADVLVGGPGGDVTWGLGYNPASQIASRTIGNDAYAWGGHQALQRAYTTNGRNQYSQTQSGAGTVAYGHDDNGNLTAEGTRTFTYDIENRLVGASPSTGPGGAGAVTLSYDPLGRLYEVAGPSETKRFVWDGDALVNEYNSGGTMTDRYVHGAAAGADDPLVWYDGVKANFFHADHQGSIVAVTTFYAPPRINAYDEYGAPATDAQGQNVNTGRFQYTGQLWLADLGMYHYKARIYHPRLGRFLQVDPVGYADQHNLYAYVGNDPVNTTDPSGLYRCVTNDNSERCRTYNGDDGSDDEREPHGPRAYGQGGGSLLPCEGNLACWRMANARDLLDGTIDGGEFETREGNVTRGGIIGASLSGGILSGLAWGARLTISIRQLEALGARLGFPKSGDFGRAVGWGGGRAALREARARIPQITPSSVAGIRAQFPRMTHQLVRLWRNHYRARQGNNDVARARADLMDAILRNW